MIRVRAPLRISFFGGGTDFPEYFTQRSGAVLGTAIRRYVELDVTTAMHEPTNGATIEEESQSSLARRAWQAIGERSTFSLVARCDAGTAVGLGTSSSCVVAALAAADLLHGRQSTPLERAYRAAELERRDLQTIVGCQDHVFAAVGGLNVVEFRGANDFGVFSISLTVARRRELEAHLLLVDTGLRRRSGPLASRHVERLDHNLESLQFFRRAVDVGYEELVGVDSLASFGRLLDVCWQRKRALGDGVTNPQIDVLYATAIEHGAWGGKLLGSGGGGYLLLCAPPESREALRSALAGHRMLGVQLADDGADANWIEPATADNRRPQPRCVA